jgi:hypothetical protein
MLRSLLDHIVITAPSLETGAEYVQRTLGVTLTGGGEHPLMGTHNRFLRLGDAIYLEVVAVNPAAPAPNRPRWFGLDHMGPDQSPLLKTWVARTDDILAAASAASISLGDVEAVTRGSLRWLMTIPPDGALALQGIAPLLIQWPPGIHPTRELPDSGCRLVRLEAFHPQSTKVKQLLADIGFEGDVRVRPLPSREVPFLVAHIESPAGLHHLCVCERKLRRSQ